MNEMLVPLFPSVLWLAACAVAILLIVVLFGYHLYQRARMKAIVGDSESVGALAAKKESLEHELREIRGTINDHRQELLKIEADRRKQELFRADLDSLGRSLEEKRQENEKQLDNLASLDNQVSRRKQALGRLDAEIAVLEKKREEMAPLEQSAQDLRIELERGNVKLAQLAEQELKVGALMHQARDLAREIEDLTHTLEPLRHEKNRLRLFVEQARHSSAVKNEQILDQKRELMALEERKKSLVGQIASLERHLTQLNEAYAEKSTALDEINSGLAAAIEEKNIKSSDLAAQLDNLREEKLKELERETESRRQKLDDLVEQIQLAQIQLEQTLLRKDERVGEVAALAGRAAVLQREIEKLAHAAEKKPAEKSGARAKKQARIRLPGKSGERRRRVRPAGSVEVVWKNS